MRLSTLLVSAVLAVATPLGVHAQHAPATVSALPSDSIYQLDMQFVDQSGKRVALRDLRGHPQLVTMFYTSCRYICPLIIDTGLGIDRSLTPAERAKLGINLVSMDPKRDTPEMLMSVANRRKLDLSRWTLLRPRPADVRTIAGVLGIKYRELADGEFNHTSALILVDGSGRVLALTEQLGSVPDPAFLKAIRSALR